MVAPLVSVVIPTHNRVGYAFDCIQSLLNINDDNLEVVVSDTSTTEDLSLRLATLNLKSFKTNLNYFKPKQQLDMTGNHNSVVACAKGEYVCLIGDDDTVTHELISAAKWAKLNNVDCLSPNIVCNYAWPDFRTLSFGAAHAGRLYLPKRIGTLKCVQGADALLTALTDAAQGTNGLPKLYHGLVRRSLLNQLRNQSGSYFHGSSPDVSIAVGLAYFIANRQGSFYTIDYPLTIPGASGGSNTGRSAMNTHKGRLENEKQTSAFASSGWSFGVPKFFSVETVWAHACLSTLSAMGASDELLDYNYSRLLAICLSAHPEFKDEINNAICDVADKIQMPVNKLTKKVNLVRAQLIFRRLGYLARRALWPTASGGRPFVGGICSILDTSNILQSWLDKRGIDFLKIVSY